MPITQEQMLEQVRESRANHEEMKALRTLTLAYIESARKRFPNNGELQEVLGALEYTIRMRNVPDDRATYMNERYYARFAKRNDKAKKQQAAIRAGVHVPKHRAGRILLENDDSAPLPKSDARYTAFRNNPPNPQNTFADGKRHHQKPIMPREYDDDKPLEFDMPLGFDPNKPQIVQESPLPGLDIPADPYDNGLPTNEGD